MSFFYGTAGIFLFDEIKNIHAYFKQTSTSKGPNVVTKGITITG